MKIQFISEAEYEVSELTVDNLFNSTYCVFDLEATGPSPVKDHIIQIGAVRISAASNDTLLPDSSYMSYVRSPVSISPFIEQLTGVTNDHIADAPGWDKVYDNFLAFAEGTILVTQAGYEYDWPLIQAECNRRQLPVLNMPILDTKVLYQYLYPEEEGVISTNLLIERLGVDDSGLARHDALSDSIRIARIFRRLMDQYRERSIQSLNLCRPMTVKRFQLPKQKR
ncbi:PolC-type DNA polymerase III [Paenibacillus sp. 1011MAR3C5]|uniref:3'-5' exonuclease n=1 Tax=Paenibacillus sp. 1011MAR3C5 TaxID=1675787 RepID=UPI0016013749|nr:3'-5' exonuclease [Paenibacillus sp. 1011MAR3C5]